MQLHYKMRRFKKKCYVKKVRNLKLCIVFKYLATK